MPKVTVLVNGLVYDGKLYNVGDEVEARPRHAKVLRALGKVGPMQPQAPLGAAMETLPSSALPAAPVVPTEPVGTQEPSQGKQQEQADGQSPEGSDARANEGDAGDGRAAPEALADAEGSAGQTNRPARRSPRFRS